MTDPTLSAQDQQRLIAIAREAIASELGIATDSQAARGVELDDVRGVFVSVSVRKRLRGCIGMIEGEHPLVTEVASMARAAAFRDPRFNPITVDDFGDLRVEISVLSPLRPISGPQDVDVGRDGLVVERGTRRGLLLPQVASERGWDAETFVRYTCDKAGLPADEWRDADTHLFAFTATVIEEAD